ncbi:hypothetical protein AXF42_Ash004732 [Apostasia shenzhenica]|uniref:TOM1-like protein 2 n=1 Tax=Apostasia shenzhenica TaxID=1088818 RepID=A0A2I0BHI3_9ASPA|nr:hypothetical protein AXF42_Ash004732 [Apostasia shenzhenica]
MSSSATVRVEKATSDLLLGPDWTMNMDICDSINTDAGLAKDVVKAVKKRLQHKNPRVQFFALTLLEAMIKNCGDVVHFQVVERDVLPEMVKIVRKKTDMEVRNKILVLLDSWQEAFGGPGGKYPQYFWSYSDLKRDGVEFPHRPGDSTLIFSSPTNQNRIPRHLQAGYGMPSNSLRRLDEAMASDITSLSLSDLSRIREIMELLRDMLKAVNPQDHEAIRDEVIIDLVSQCRSNQKKILQLIDSTGDEDLLGQGLELNDSLQSLLAQHDAIASGSPLPDPEAFDSVPRPGTPVEPATTVTLQFEDEEEEDDEFAQLARRNSKINSTTHDTSADIGKRDSSSNEATMGRELALPNPPRPVKTATNEQNIIDLLSITLASSPTPPHTPISTSTAFHPNGSGESVTPNGECYHPPNHGYAPYRTYVAPWPQTQPTASPQSRPHSRSEFQPQIPHQLQTQAQTFPSQPPQVAPYTSYPPPPWEDSPGASPNPFTEATQKFSTPVVNSYPSYSTMPQYSSSGMNAANSPVGVGKTPAVSHKPFVPSHRLFEDLVETRNPSGDIKASSTSCQGMFHDRK